MKRVIRRNCFETNSSSMHSIVVLKEDHIIGKEDLEKIFWFKDHVMSTWGEDALYFGRAPFRYLTSVEDKIWFVIASYCSYTPKKECDKFIENLSNSIKKRYPEFGGIKIPIVYHSYSYVDSNNNPVHPNDIHYGERFETVDEATGKTELKYFKYYLDDSGNKCEVYESDDSQEIEYYGDIDHQSAGLLQGFLDSHNLSVEDFVFNDKYKVVIDGDEYCIFSDMVKSGLISNSTVAEIYPKMNLE